MSLTHQQTVALETVAVFGEEWSRHCDVTNPIPTLHALRRRGLIAFEVGKPSTRSTDAGRAVAGKIKPSRCVVKVYYRDGRIYITHPLPRAKAELWASLWERDETVLETRVVLFPGEPDKAA